MTILWSAFKNTPLFPEAFLEIGGGVRLGCCLTIALFEIGGMVWCWVWFGFSKIGVLVAIGNKLGNRLVMVTRELAKPDNRLISEYVNRG